MRAHGLMSKRIAAIVFAHVLALHFASGLPAHAQTGGQLDEEIAALVVQLGSVSFHEREQASAELYSIGEPALASLAVAEGSGSIEVRQRASMIRRQIDERLFRKTAAEFLRDPQHANSHSLPSWSSFSAIVGTSRSAKPLFLEMVERQRGIARAIEIFAREAAQVAREKRMSLPSAKNLKLVAGEAAMRMDESLRRRLIVPELGDSVALLLTASVLDGDVPFEVHGMIQDTVFKANFRAGVKKPGYDKALKSLLGKWILATPATSIELSHTSLFLTYQDEIPDGIVVARRVLALETDLDVRRLALMCLAKYGTTDDIPRAERFLKDDAVLAEFLISDLPGGFRAERAAPPGGGQLPGQAAEPGKMKVRIADFALAICMILAKQDLSAIFPNFRENSMDERGFAFPVDDPSIRENAFLQWEKSRSGKSPIVPPVKQ